MKQSAWLGLGLSLALLVLVFRSADFGRIGHALGGADYLLLGLGVAIYFLTIGLRALRWQQLLAPVETVDFRRLYSVTAIGQMGNVVLPARSGEFARAYLIGRRGNIPFSTALATIVVERLFDGLVVLLLTFLVVITFPDAPDWLRTGGYVAAAFYLGLLVFFGLLAARPRHALRLAHWLLAPLPDRVSGPIEHWLASFVGGLSGLRRKRQVAAASLYSLALWFIFGVLTFLVAASLRLNLSLQASFVVLVAIAFAATLPSAPGLIGTMQFFSVLGLGLFGIGADDALSFSILYTAAYSLPIALVGLAFLSLERLSLADISGRTRDLLEPGTPAMSPQK